MAEWNGHHKDYDYSDPRYTLENLRLHEESVVRNIEYVKELNDSGALDYYLPKLAALRTAIRQISS